MSANTGERPPCDEDEYRGGGLKFMVVRGLGFQRLTRADRRRVVNKHSLTAKSAVGRRRRTSSTRRLPPPLLRRSDFPGSSPCPSSGPSVDAVNGFSPSVNHLQHSAACGRVTRRCTRRRCRRTGLSRWAGEGGVLCPPGPGTPACRGRALVVVRRTIIITIEHGNQPRVPRAAVLTYTLFLAESEQSARKRGRRRETLVYMNTESIRFCF